MLGFNQSEMKSHWSILCRDITCWTGIVKEVPGIFVEKINAGREVESNQGHHGV